MTTVILVGIGILVVGGTVLLGGMSLFASSEDRKKDYSRLIEQ